MFQIAGMLDKMRLTDDIKAAPICYQFYFSKFPPYFLFGGKRRVREYDGQTKGSRGGALAEDPLR